jgi:hypothetical protein
MLIKAVAEVICLKIVVTDPTVFGITPLKVKGGLVF